MLFAAYHFHHCVCNRHQSISIPTIHLASKYKYLRDICSGIRLSFNVRVPFVIHTFISFVAIAHKKIFVAGMALPWIAYLVGWCIATVFKQKHEDRVAIAIEAGIQNTGIAIYILRTTLDQPQADLTTVVSAFQHFCS